MHSEGGMDWTMGVGPHLQCQPTGDADCLRDKSLNILNLPNELLEDIFALLQDDQQSEAPYHFENSGRNRGDIKNVRLTCRRFCGTSSHLLMSHIAVDLTPAGLEHISAVSQHPTIFKGIRSVRVYVCFYSRRLATDLQHFASVAAHRLLSRLEESERCRNEGQQGRVQREHSTYLAKDVVAQAKKTVKIWTEFVHDQALGETTQLPVVSSRNHPSVNDLLIVWEIYKRRQLQQSQILQDGTFVHTIASAMARLRKATRLEINDGDSGLRDQKESLTPLSANNGPRKSFSGVIESMMLQPSKWVDARNEQLEAPPIEVLTALPLALQEAGVALTVLSINVTPSEDFDLKIREADIDRLSFAARKIQYFSFKTPAIGWHPTQTPDEVSSFWTFLCIMMNPGELRGLKLDLKFMEARNGASTSFGRLLLHPASWPNLTTISLGSMSMRLSELEELFLKTRSSGSHNSYASTVTEERRVQVSLKRIALLDGRWVDALHVLREHCGPGSQVLFPILDTTFEGDYQHAFYLQGYPPVKQNRATEYIQRRTDQNPLVN
ncbi:hypothetical protein SCAR479_04128 [Seiridium cardinale]|uniref:F-box domain-containing protein n=1 Tax=Seiridium cardinale TaxID=138064 RepID=A0ABR2XYM4_9PEZI